MPTEKAEAAEFPETPGQIREYAFVGPGGDPFFPSDDLRPYAIPRPGGSGLLLYGPYSSYPPGRYLAGFSFIKHGAGPSKGEARLDVAHSGGKGILAEKTVSLAGLASERAEWMEFRLDARNDFIEFRVSLEKSAGVAACRAIAVVPLGASREEALSSRPDADERGRYSRAMTQREPLEIPLSGSHFNLLVKIDYPGVIVPPSESHVFAAVEKRIERDSGHIKKYVDRITPHAFGGIIESVPESETDETAPYWANPMLTGADARVLYAMAAALRPKRVIEIGSGFSTRFVRRAIADHRLATRLVCIDPAPRSGVLRVADEFIGESAQTVEPARFDQLSDGDILFVDGSHITFPGSDTACVFLEILPRLAKGVHIHFHDINLPWEYTRGYIAHYYSEQYMLASLLLASDRYTVCFPNHWLGKRVDEKWKGVSFWIRKEA